MARRVRRPKDKEQLQNDLTGRNGPFETYKDLLVFAAALGFARHTREPLDHGTLEPIDWGVFKGDDEALIQMLAVADTQSLEPLAETRFEEQIQIFEEYANGGLSIMQQHFASSTQPRLNTLIEMMLSVRARRAPGDEPALDQLLDSLF
jgi:dnd system-associated protein 4